MEQNNKNDVNKAKLLYLRRISLTKNKNMQKNLNHFFWNANNYFQKDYDEFDIILGNKKNKKYIIPFIKVTPAKRRRRNSITELYNNNSQSHEKKNNESKITLTSNNSRFGGKRGYLKNNKENGLKVGQKYISESELEELFHAFCSVQKMNKKKSNNFIMAKDYIDNNILNANKTISNFGKYNENKKNILSGNNKVLPELSSSLFNNKSTKNSISAYNNDKNKINLKLFKNKNLKIIEEKKNDLANSNKTQKLKMNIFSNDIMEKTIDLNDDIKYKTANNFFVDKNILDFQKLKSRNKLVQRQNQYLNSKKELEGEDNNKAINDYYAQLLADQEQVMMDVQKSKKKKGNILKIISKRAKKKEKNLLLKDLESYRIQNELKDKFCVLGEKLEPEHNYNWKRDLRGDLYKHTQNEDNPNYFNIRDPYNKIISGSFSDKNLTKQVYMKYYKNLIEENDNINKNLEGLYIKGKNLLKMEYEQFKNNKNRKIINNYETYLPSAEVEDIIFIDNKNIKKIKREDK